MLMKHKLLLTFIGLAVSFTVMAQSNRTNPDVALSEVFTKPRKGLEISSWAL